MNQTAPQATSTPIAAHDGAPLLTRHHDNTWTVTLNRPAHHNRLDPADVTALTALFETARTEQPAALIITGAGARTFSSGYTLSALVSELDGRFEAMLDSLETLPLLTIAAINGGLYGGATDLALCCDIRLGVRGARMFMPAAKFGLHYYPGGLRRYVTRLGLPVASRLMLTAMTMYDDEMLRVGYLHELLEPDQMAARVAEYRDSASANDPKVVAAMKAQMQALAAHQNDAERAALEQQMLQDHQASVKSTELAERVARHTAPAARKT